MHMNIKLHLTLAAVLLALAGTAQAKWYTATGTAPILSSTSQARDDAVNDAIRNAMLEAGAQVSVEQNFKDGVLQGSSANVKSTVPVRRVQVTSEQKTSGRVTVTVKVLLDDSNVPPPCSASRIKKSVVPTSFMYADQNSALGAQGVDTINRELSRDLYAKLSLSPLLLVRPEQRVNLRGSASGNSADAQLSGNIIALGRQHDSQYLISGTVDAAAASDPGELFITKMLFQRTRSLTFTVNLYDTAAGREVFSKTYSMECDWPFKQGEYLDLRSERFRGSPYGQRMQQLIADAVTDLVTELQCLNPEATIIDTDDEGFYIDMGAVNNVSKGMKFSIRQTSQGFEPDGETYDRRDAARGLYVVHDVYETTARLVPEDLDDNLLNIRVNDRVMLEP